MVMVVAIGDTVAVIILRIFSIVIVMVTTVVIITVVHDAIIVCVGLCQRVLRSKIIEHHWAVEYAVVVTVVGSCSIPAKVERYMTQVDHISFSKNKAGPGFVCVVSKANGCNDGIIGAFAGCHNDSKTDASGQIKLEWMLAGAVVGRFD
jgi:hypothetical protein